MSLRRTQRLARPSSTLIIGAAAGPAQWGVGYGVFQDVGASEKLFGKLFGQFISL